MYIYVFETFFTSPMQSTILRGKMYRWSCISYCVPHSRVKEWNLRAFVYWNVSLGGLIFTLQWLEVQHSLGLATPSHLQFQHQGRWSTAQWALLRLYTRVWSVHQKAVGAASSKCVPWVWGYAQLVHNMCTPWENPCWGHSVLLYVGVRPQQPLGQAWRFGVRSL